MSEWQDNINTNIPDNIDFALDPSLLDLNGSWGVSEDENLHALESGYQFPVSSAPLPIFDDGFQHELPSVDETDANLNWSTQSHSQPDLVNVQPINHEHEQNQHDQLQNDHNAQIPPQPNQSSLPRRRSRYFIPRSGTATAPIFIPNATALDPMQRWQESPPEDEPASMSAILDAVKNTPSRGSHSRQSSRGQSQPRPSPSQRRPVDAFRHYRRTASTTSGESSGSSRQSASANSPASQSPSRDRPSSRRSRGRVSKNTNTNTKPDPGADKKRIFCCTFCCDRFKTKYDWSRHEKSLHLNLEEWICTPNGPSVFSPSTGRTHCAYCNALDPTPDHLLTHNHKVCDPTTDKNNTRTFRRKDHLVQHLRLVHHLDTVPLLDDWKVKSPPITSRCGFCDSSLSSWEERIDHLAGHFKKGLSMKDWRGEHDFPPDIAVQVTHSLPPYLIETESKSMVPFSATNAGTRDHFAQISSRAAWESKNSNSNERELESIPDNPTTNVNPMAQLSSFTEILTLHLSHYAREQVQNGVIPTDEMFQQESRRVLYDCEDSWNQTIADNSEWLAAFRRLHCER